MKCYTPERTLPAGHSVTYLNPSSQEVEAEVQLPLATKWVWEQPGLHEILPLQKKKKKGGEN